MQRCGINYVCQRLSLLRGLKPTSGALVTLSSRLNCLLYTVFSIPALHQQYLFHPPSLEQKLVEIRRWLT